MKNELFTRTDVAHIFSVHPLTVKSWEKSGRLKVELYVGRHPRYSIEALEKLGTPNPTTLKQQTAEHA